MDAAGADELNQEQLPESPGMPEEGMGEPYEGSKNMKK